MNEKGVMAAWELRLADYSVDSFDDMTVLDFRQIFADREFEPGMLELEVRKDSGLFPQNIFCIVIFPLEGPMKCRIPGMV